MKTKLLFIFSLISLIGFSQNVTVNNGATLTVASGKYISIGGNFSNSGTTTLNYFIYQEAFETFNLGRASAAAYVLLIITLAVVLIPTISRFLIKFFWGNK